MRINRIIGAEQLAQIDNADKKITKVDFGEVLSRAIDAVSDAEKTSIKYDELVATGNIDNLHDAMIAAQKAEITLNFAIKVRKGVLDAYQELMRLQI